MMSELKRSSVLALGLWIALSACALGQAPTQNPEPAKEVAVAEGPADEKPQRTFVDYLHEQYRNAKEAGSTRARSAGHWLSEHYTNVTNNASEFAESTTEWVSELYNDAYEAGETSARNTSEWVAQDVGKIGTWQYTVIEEPRFDDLEKTLNKMGDQRWECIQVIYQPGEHIRAVLKRPHRSYLQQLPAKDLLRLFPLLQSGGDDAPAE